MRRQLSIFPRTHVSAPALSLPPARAGAKLPKYSLHRTDATSSIEHMHVAHFMRAFVSR